METEIALIQLLAETASGRFDTLKIMSSRAEKNDQTWQNVLHHLCDHHLNGANLRKILNGEGMRKLVADTIGQM